MTVCDFGRKVCAVNYVVLAFFLVVLTGLLFSLSYGDSSSAVDFNKLGQSDWWSTVQRDISQMEYEVTWQDHSVIPDGAAGYHMANRAQNLRAYFYSEGMKVVERTDRNPSWVWGYQLNGFGRKGDVKSLGKPSLTTAKNRIEYHYGPLMERYENRVDGIKQSFFITHQPNGSGLLVLEAKISGNLSAQVTEDHSAVEFLYEGETVLQYGGLQILDANGRELPASLSLNGNQLQIAIYDAGAVYPLTIDPVITGKEQFGLSTSADWTAESDQAEAQFGLSVSTAGDVNGDGYSDIIVGANWYDNGQANEGRVFVYHGSATGLSATADWTAESDQAAAQLGYSVATAGDVNGDGYGDVIIGAHYYDNGQTDEGRAFVYYGSASGLSATADWTAESDQGGAYFGGSVATAGDVNGDGYSDVIVGAYGYDNGQTDEGGAFVYYGSASGLSTTADWTVESDQDYTSFGWSVAMAGDVNGDGYSDVIVGAFEYDNGQTDEGGAFVYYGSASGLSPTADWTAESDQDYAWLGWSVATAGDVNGDGYSDVIVGAEFYDNGQEDEGRAFVYYGSASGLSATADWTAEGDQVNAGFGISVATAGDVNGDGYSDVIVGAEWFDNGQTNEGHAFVYYGSSSGLSVAADWTAESDQTDALFGSSVATAGDVNGDGYSDIIIGSTDYDNGQTDEGAAFVYHGSASGLSATADWTAESNQGNPRFGYSVSTAGDVNGDGYSDVIVGAYLYDNGETDEGRAFVYHGSVSGLSTTADWTAEGNQMGAYFGSFVSTAGDVNGDGYSDVIVGASRYDNGENDEGAAFVYHGSASGLSTTPDWSAEGNQADAWFGHPVSTAGDINGDGYSDVIVGARQYDNPETDEGRVFVYHGSASGLGAVAAWTAESNQANVYFGTRASTAGDVNGDGYSDIIVGAYGYANGETDEGGVFVYHGSASGLSTTPDWTAESNQADARLSIVGTAGDVNGDGYSDIIVGAYMYDNGETDEGLAYVYYGSASGLSTNADWMAEGNQASAWFGQSLATAGDLNGDGYADVIVGAYGYNNGQTDEGLAYVYYGSAAGLSTNADWMAEGNQASAFFGFSVSTAGDVNGDGYADVIISAFQYTNGETNEGRVFVYYGNGEAGPGLSLHPQQRRADDSVAIAHLGKSDSEDSFRLALLGHSPFGRAKVKLEWEVKPLGTLFDGTGTQQSAAWTDTGIAGVAFNELVNSLSAGTVYHWRVRLLYHPATVPFQQHSRWLTMPLNGWEEADLRTYATPTPTPTATPTATPTPTPTATATPTPSPTPWQVVYDFVPDREEWTSGSAPIVFSVPEFAWDPDYLKIISSTNTNMFGFWQSPPDAIPADASYLYRARFTISTDVTDQELVPWIRVRANSQNLQQYDVLSIESAGDGGASPTPSGTDYDLYFVPPANETAMMLAFDLLNFNPFDAAEAELSLDTVTVDRFDLSSLPAATTVQDYTFELSTDGWTTGGAPIVFSSPQYIYADGALELRATTDTNTFGFWGNNPADIAIEADRLYRGTFEVRTDLTAQELVPEMRLRFNVGNLQASHTFGISSAGDGANSPGMTNTTYDRLYFVPPANCVGEDLLVSFDILNFNPGDAADGSLILDRATIEALSLPLFP